MRRTILSLALALALCLGLALPATAYGDMGKSGIHNTVQIGEAHAGAIDRNSSLWMWGRNDVGQLGNHLAHNAEIGYKYAQTIPDKVMDDVASFSCGYKHTAILKTDGSLWMVGDNQSGQLGNGGAGNVVGGVEQTPVAVQTIPVKVMDSVAAVSCGVNFTAVIKKDGSLWMFGDNQSGQLGNGGGGNVQGEYGAIYQTTPVKVMDDVAAVSCGGYYGGECFTAAIKTDGSLWMWGNNFNGNLGNGTLVDSAVPVKVMDGVTAVSCGDMCTAAVKTDGSLWMWGGNTWGQLGNGIFASMEPEAITWKTSPIKVMDGVIAVSCGYSHVAAIKTDGSLWMWGNNYEGALGNGGKGNGTDGYTTYQTVPAKLMDNVVAVRCGYESTAVIKGDGSLWMWGRNDLGQLGNGSSGNADAGSYDGLCQTVPVKTMDNIKVPQNTGAVPSAPSVKTAQPTSDALTVNGVLQNPTVYNIDGNNYFKIRDLAAILNGTEKQFSVGYDATLKSVTVTTGQSYDKQPTDLVGAPTGGSKTAEVSKDTIYINGQKVDAQVYMIGGNNYFKLRDLGKALNFYVGWTKEQGVFIETDKPYQD